MKSVSVSPLSKAKPPGAGLGCIVPFGLVFAAIGLVAFWFVSLRPALRALDSADWVETPCEILSSELERHSGSKGGSTYRAAISYRYEYEGRVHQSDRYDFSTGSTNVGVGKIRAAVRENPPGRRTVCYVDPSNPDSATLNRAIPDLVWFGSFTLLFPAFGGLMIFLTWKNARKPRAEARSPLGSASPAAPDIVRVSHTGPDAADFVPEGETLIKPAAGRIGTFIGLTFFTLFWNGIVSVFVVQAVKEFGRGFIGWFLPLFLIPFVLVGLLMLGAALQAFSRLFAPAVEVRLDPSRLRLGARVPFAWRLGGRGVRKLTIRLVAREEATYRRGTSTTTDKSDIHRAVVFESTDILGLANGRAEILLPDISAAPAFSAKNNKLVWELVFDGEIPWRADVDDRFILSVRGPEHLPVVSAAPEPTAFSGEGLTLWTVDRFAPGETLVFTLSRDTTATPGPLTAQLGWFTEGRGTRDAAIAWSEPIPSLAPGTDRTFEVRLPETPWSFSGKLVSVSWRLEVLDTKNRPLVAVPLVVAPAGAIIALPELPKEKSLRKWKFAVGS